MTPYDPDLDDERSRSRYFNFVTGDFDPPLSVPFKELPVTAMRDYLPQDSTVQLLFTLLMKTGVEPADAYLEVLKRVTGRT